MAAAQLTFPLIPRRRVIGLAFGGLHSSRRGTGSDVAGSRPYQPGDDMKTIDWASSARLSSARGSDEFIVREYFAEEAPRVVVVADRRPAMSIFSEEWPWLEKAAALRHSTQLIADSAVAARGVLGYLDHGEERPYWRPPRSEREVGRLELDRPFGAPDDATTRGLAHLARQRRDLPAGTFVFVLSDFLSPPPREAWQRMIERRWDVVPVVIQDPVWERSFPDVSGVVVPFVDPGSGGVTPIGVTAAEAQDERARNEERWTSLLRDFRALDLDPVVVDSDDPRQVARSFLAWSDRRALSRGRR